MPNNEIPLSVLERILTLQLNRSERSKLVSQLSGRKHGESISPKEALEYLLGADAIFLKKDEQLGDEGQDIPDIATHTNPSRQFYFNVAKLLTALDDKEHELARGAFFFEAVRQIPSFLDDFNRYQRAQAGKLPAKRRKNLPEGSDGKSRTIEERVAGPASSKAEAHRKAAIIPYAVLHKIYVGRDREMIASITGWDSRAVSPEGVDSKVFAEWLLSKSPKNDAFPSKYLELRGKLERYGAGSSVLATIDGIIEREYPGVYVRGTDGRYRVLKVNSEYAPVSALRGKAEYTAAELVKHGVLTHENVSGLEESLKIHELDVRPMPRVWWGIMIATKLGKEPALAKLGFGDNAENNGGGEELQLSETEKGIFNWLDKNSCSGLTEAVKGFYSRGKPFMEYPLMVLLWVAGTVAEGKRSLPYRPNAAQIIEGNYIRKVKGVLEECVKIWSRNAEVIEKIQADGASEGLPKTVKFSTATAYITDRLQA